MTLMTDRSAAVDVRAADCRVRAATDVLGHRWDGVVLAVLGAGPHRRVELREAIGQVRDKPLTESLARLMESNLIVRRRRNQTPPGVVYELTALGQTFHDGPLRALASWAQEHGEGLLDVATR
jgi:DNA-binding HxlR family transcriptional regulator